MAYQSWPDPCPIQTWDYNKWKDPRYTTAMGKQLTEAVPIDALRRTGLPEQAYGRFSTLQDRLILAPRAYIMQTAMLSGAEALAQIQNG